MNPGFDTFVLPEEHQLLRKTVRDLAETKIAPRAAEIDETGEFPWDVYRALVDAELHAVHIPEKYAGSGADAIASVIVIEEIARVCAASALIPIVNKLGTMPLLLAASEEVKATYLPRVASGEAMFSYCLSEPDAGSDAASMKTRAERHGGDYILNGVKRWISNAEVSELYTVMAVTDPDAGANGISAFVVEKSDAGVSFGAPEKKLGIKGSPTREVYFDDVRIPASRMIGEPGTGFKTALRTLDHTRLTIGAQALGLAQGAVDYCTRYVQERQQFGKPIIEFQGVSFLLADMAMKTEAARALIYSAAAASERQDPGLTFTSAAAKCFASDTAMQVTTDGVQLLGGYGYTRDFPLERMMRDAKITQIYEGTNQILRLVMARNLVKANPAR
ncbi:MAG TPA: acyl-CoA dehydrogenase family protein [Mycobacteriales bacterium]|nr:acyl-CoA dehydrogenase family protein [Mycobacteriales bacterium]